MYACCVCTLLNPPLPTQLQPQTHSNLSPTRSYLLLR
jgi:hypothetical protein